MDRTERFYKIESLLRSRRVVSFAQMQQLLEVSRATLRRDLRYMRERLNMPIEWLAEQGGYRIAEAEGDRTPHPLPNLWFTTSEVHALLTLDHLVRRLDPAGVLASHVEPLERRLNALLEDADEEGAQLRQRVKIIGLARRVVQPRHFQRVGTALVRRKRLRIRYLARSSGHETEREVSPLRLIHYRENWYLDAWCHLRSALRNFAVDAIQEAVVLDRAAKDVSPSRLDEAFGPGYGIFSGRQVRWARLRFSPERARWVAQEDWHPEQKGRWDDQGRWLLDLPYADPRELVMDILRYVPDVEVLGPLRLRDEVACRLHEGLRALRQLDRYTGIQPQPDSPGEPGA